MEQNEKYWNRAKNLIYERASILKGGERNETLNKYFTIWKRKHYLTTHNRINFQYKRLNVKKNCLKTLRKHKRTLALKN